MWPRPDRVGRQELEVIHPSKSRLKRLPGRPRWRSHQFHHVQNRFSHRREPVQRPRRSENVLLPRSGLINSTRSEFLKAFRTWNVLSSRSLVSTSKSSQSKIEEKHKPEQKNLCHLTVTFTHPVTLRKPSLPDKNLLLAYMCLFSFFCRLDKFLKEKF